MLEGSCLPRVSQPNIQLLAVGFPQEFPTGARFKTCTADLIIAASVPAGHDEGTLLGDALSQLSEE